MDLILLIASMMELSIINENQKLMENSFITDVYHSHNKCSDFFIEQWRS
jgi:hypothetical protein